MCAFRFFPLRAESTFVCLCVCVERVLVYGECQVQKREETEIVVHPKDSGNSNGQALALRLVQLFCLVLCLCLFPFAVLIATTHVSAVSVRECVQLSVFSFSCLFLCVSFLLFCIRSNGTIYSVASFVRLFCSSCHSFRWRTDERLVLLSH